MACRPESPVKGDVGSGSCVCVESSRRRAVDSAVSVATALEVGIGDISHGSVALDRTRYAVRCRAGVGVGVWLVEGVGRTTDSGIVNIAVGSNSRSERDGGQKILHREMNDALRTVVMNVKFK